MNEAHLPYADFQKAIDENLGSLARLAQTYPVDTLTYMDGMMRGLLGGPYAPEQIDWLVDADRVIRRLLGGRQRDADLAILRGAYQHSALYLVLGAGISQGAGLPGWKDLVVQVLDHAGQIPISNDLRARVLAVRDALQRGDRYTSAELLAASEAASAALGRRFPQALRTVLYQRAPTRTRMLEAIRGLVRPREQWGQTARLSAIITFNFDDLTERTLTRAGIGSTAHASVDGQWKQMRGGAAHQESAIDIYHVHGYAPDAPADIDAVDFVLTEEQFAKIYQLETGLARSVQSIHLTGSLGLILGSSLSDEYALNELRAAHAKNPGWYNYVMMHDGEARSKEEYAKLGLRVLWFHEFDEIAELLEQLVRAA